MKTFKHILHLTFILILTTSCSDDITKPEIEEVQPLPPYEGTVWIESEIITENDPSSFQSIRANGTGLRTMYDRRVNDWIQVEAHLFEVTFEKFKIEAQVNPEFTSEEAQNLAAKYSEVIGKMPAVLLSKLETIWIHNGNEGFGGGNNSFDIYKEFGEVLESRGVLEEVFLHEGTHVSLDLEHASSSDWKSAQNNDPTFISTYAKDNPSREDLAESFLTYFAVRFTEDRLTNEMKNVILSTIPNRIQYLDNQDFDYSPWGD